MKKIFRLLLLGFLTVTVLSPSIVTAAEDQTVQEPSSSVYSNIDNVDPVSTPYITEITLEHEETFDFSRLMVFFPVNGTVCRFIFKIRPLINDSEAFMIQRFESINEDFRLINSPVFYYSKDVVMLTSLGHEYKPNVPYGSWEVHPAGVRITNYSPGTVSFKIGINIGYGTTSSALDFDLG